MPGPPIMFILPISLMFTSHIGEQIAKFAFNIFPSASLETTDYASDNKFALLLVMRLGIISEIRGESSPTH